MSMFFNYYGYLEFESEAIAQKHYDILTGDNDSWFRAVPQSLELVGKKIRFIKDGNFNSYSSCEKTKDLIYEAAGNATKGSVKVDEGDSEKDLWNKELIPASGKPSITSVRAYRFSGQFEFESESIAKFHCKRLLTNSAKSAFTKFERVSVGDKRDLRFDGKHLIIECQYTIDSSIFKKTEKLLGDVEAHSIGGKIEITEVKACKFERDGSNAPRDWVNDMNRDIFYRVSGSVLYHTAAEAEAACVKLLSDESSAFKLTGKSSFPVHVSKELRLVFDDINCCHRKMLNATGHLIRAVVEFARTGKVEIAFSYIETMDSFVVDRITPSKVRKWNKFVNK